MKPATQTPPDRTEDERALRALYDELMQGWNDGSGARFAGVFTENGDLVGFDGTHLQGRQVIVNFQQVLFDKWLKGTRLIGAVHDLRFLGPDTAVMHAIGDMLKRGATKPQRARASIQTLTAVRTDEGWRIAAFQNTRVRPIGTGFLAFLHWTLGDAIWGVFRLSTDSKAAISAITARAEAPRISAGS
jgi:uncharacterized protein (TIGR02246 family)